MGPIREQICETQLVHTMWPGHELLSLAGPVNPMLYPCQGQMQWNCSGMQPAETGRAQQRWANHKEKRLYPPSPQSAMKSSHRLSL